MSFVSVKDAEGRDVEIRTGEDLLALYANSRYCADLYREALLERVRENKAQNKPPFEGVDFPDCSKKDLGLNISIITGDEELKKAITEQVSNHDSAGLEKFLLEQKTPDTWNTGLEEGMKDAWLSAERNKKTLDAVIVVSSKLRKEFEYSGKILPINQLGSFYVSERLKAGDKLSQRTAQAVVDLLSERPSTVSNYSSEYLSVDCLRELTPQLMALDFGSFSDKDKQKIEDNLIFASAGGMSKQDYIEKAQPQNLSRESFLQRKTMTMEDVEKHFTNRNGYSSKDAYEALKKAPEDNKTAASIRGQMAVEAIANAQGNMSYHSGLEVEVGAENIVFSYEDVICGYKENPEALKAFGSNIPDLVLDAVGRDETLANNPDFKFLIEEYKLGYTDILSGETSLKEIAEKGLEAGFRADHITSKVGLYLESHREEIERLKAGHEQELAKEERAAEINARYSKLQEIVQTISAYNRSAKTGYISSEELTALALDKIHGKEVKSFVCEDEPTKGLKGMLMKKSEKEAELKRIEEKKQAYAAANKFIEDFAKKYQNEPLLKDVTSGKSILEAREKAYEESERADGGRYKYFDKAQNVQKIEDFEKLDALYQAAQGKIESQLHAEVELKQTARETSGTKDVENNAGIDMLEVKSKIRNQDQSGKDMSPRELYEAMMKMRGLGKFDRKTSSEKDFAQSIIDLKQVKENNPSR